MESIYSRLRTWRWEKARELNVPSFFVLSNAHLGGVAVTQPTTVEDLAKCPGMGPKKLAQFGEELAGLVAQCVAEGLEPGVLPLGEPPRPEGEPEPSLSEADLQAIAEGLRKELAQRLVRRFRGKYSAAQVSEALQRLETGRSPAEAGLPWLSV